MPRVLPSALVAVVVFSFAVGSCSADRERATVTAFERIDDAPPWAVRFGEEFWRPAAETPASDQLDVERVVSRVRHALRVRADRVAADITTPSYAAAVEREGLSVGRAGAPHGLRARVSTVSIERGDTVLARGGLREWAVVGDTAQALFGPDPGIVEHVQAVPEGLELSWVLAHEPEGQGELVIRARVDGLPFRERSDAGLVFGSGESAVRFGAVTVVDADGSRTPAALAFAAGTVEISVPPEVLREARYPLAIDPVIGPEFGMDTPILAGLADNVKHMSVAGATSGYLVTWVQNDDVYAARIAPGGTLVDQIPLRVAASGYSETVPTVGTDGTNYLVCWNLRGQALCARIDAANGTVLDDPPIQVAASAQYDVPMAIAATDGTYLVAYTVMDVATSSFAVEARRVSASSGAALDAAAPVFRVPTAHQPALASKQGLFLLSWTDYRSAATQQMDLYAARITPQGLVHEPNGFLVCGGAKYQDLPAVASDGTDFMIAFRDQTSVLGGSSGDFRAALVRANGSVVQPCGTALEKRDFYESWAPALAFNGSEYVMAWEAPETASYRLDVLARRIGTNGAAVGDAVRVAATASYERKPAIARGGTNVLVAFRGEKGGYSGDSVSAVRLNATAAVLDNPPLRVTTSPNPQQYPVVAYAGGRYLVAWSDARGGTSSRVFGVRIDAGSKAVLDPAGLQLSPDLTQVTEFSLGAAGNDFLLAFMDQGESGYPTKVRRISGATGLPLDATATTVSAGYTREPIVASNGSVYLVAWAEVVVDKLMMRGRRVRASDGVVLDASPIEIAREVAVDGTTQHSIASDGTNFLVVWTGRRTSERSQTFGRRIRASDGARLDAADVRLSTDDADKVYPFVTYGAGHYLVTYMRPDPTGEAEDTSMALRVAPDGTVREPLGFRIGTGGYSRRVAWDGKSFLLVMTRSGWTAGAGFRGLVLGELAGDGRPVDPTAPELELVPTPHGALSLACGAAAVNGRSECLVVFVRNAAGVTRVHAKSLSFNRPPAAAAPPAFTAREDESLPVTLTATDADGDALTYTFTQPANGTLSGTAPQLVYVPKANYSGADSFTYTASDGVLSSPVVTVRIEVTPVNDVPVATQAAYELDEDGSVAITLTGSDVETTSPAFRITRQPTKGTLTGTAPNLVYRPSPNLYGPDDLSFVVNDGTTDSVAAKVSLSIRPINDAPVAANGSVTLDEDATASIELGATDVDGDRTSYEIVASPSHGQLGGAAPRFTYTPVANFHGTDEVRFVATDGSASSAPATVTITVRPLNDAPVAQGDAHETDEDQPLALVLGGTDPDGDALQFSIVRPPANGTLSGTYPNATYTPKANFNGTDGFAFRVSDGPLTSEAEVSISVRAVADRPVAAANRLYLDEDGRVSLTLAAEDFDGRTLSFTVVEQPKHGTLRGTAPQLEYVPEENWNGEDSLRFTASNGTLTSEPATITFEVAPVNDAPVAAPQNVATTEGASLGITLEGSDLDGDALLFSISELPANGILSGQPPNVTYTPRNGFSGNDSFGFTVSDGRAFSEARVLIGVAAAPETPVTPPPAQDGGGCGCSGAGAEAAIFTGAGLLALLRSPRRRR